MQSRSVVIDVTKGYAILLVVLGHAVQYNTPQFAHVFLFKYIYSIHMPLFMYVSGWVSYSGKPYTIHKLYNRVAQLIIPFLVWAFIKLLVDVFIYQKYASIGLQGFAQYIYNTCKYPDSGLWFLWVLFLCNVVLYLSQLITRQYVLLGLLFFLFLLNALASIFHVTLFGLGLLSWYLVFFGLGFALRKWYVSFSHSSVQVDSYISQAHSPRRKKILKVIKILAAVLYLPLLLLWNWKGAPAFITNLPFPHLVISVLALGYKLLVPITGIFFTIYTLQLVVACNKKIAIALAYLGSITLPIYAIHYYFIHLSVKFFAAPSVVTVNNFGLKVFLTFIIALFGAVVVYLIVNCIKFLRVPLWGK